MKIEQALVAVGGKASRLQNPDNYRPMAKSFLEVEGAPLLRWCLESLCLAGIKSVVLAGDREEYLDSAERVVSTLSCRFDETRFFQDEGLGVHGLPYHTKHLFSDGFFFECGHAISKPAHYQAMDAVKNEDGVVFSAFRSHPSNNRQAVQLDGTRVALKGEDRTGVALAHPMLVDQAYAEQLPSLGFNINSIIEHYAETGQLQYAWNNMPPEFDTPEELLAAQVPYSDYCRILGSQALYHSHEYLWIMP